MISIQCQLFIGSKIYEDSSSLLDHQYHMGPSGMTTRTPLIMHWHWFTGAYRIIGIVAHELGGNSESQASWRSPGMWQNTLLPYRWTSVLRFISLCVTPLYSNLAASNSC